VKIIQRALPSGQGTYRAAVQDAPGHAGEGNDETGCLDTYLSAHNKLFTVNAKEQEDLHREIPRGLNLDKILCLKTVRALMNYFTIAHNSRLYQIEKGVRSKEVTVEEGVNGSMLITHHDVRLPFGQITARPEKQQKPIPTCQQKRGHTPLADHPWNKWNR